MLNITLAQLKSDIAPMMKGTSIRQITDFYGTVFKAANRILARLDPEETRRTATLTTPFYDNVNDYVLPTDFKRMIDIRPTASGSRQNQTGLSDYGNVSARQFDEQLGANSFSIRWNNMVRTLRAQRLPAGNVVTIDDFSTPTANGAWTAEGDIAATWDEGLNWDQGPQSLWDNGLYTEPLNYVQGDSSVGFNLSGATGQGDIVNFTAPAIDLSRFNFQDASMIYFYIPVGFASRFTSFELRRGSDANNYVSRVISAKADGTAFSDGWNFLLFDWNNGTAVGSPDDTQNTYRYFGVSYKSGTLIKGCLLDSWTDSLGELYEIEYYSEYMFHDSSGAWKARPDSDSDVVNVGPASYEILKSEMMVDITQMIRTGAIRAEELADWRMMLNGQPQSRYVKDPPYHGLYADYMEAFPSDAIVMITRAYSYDI